MTSQQQLVMEPPLRALEEDSRPSTVKTILLHIIDDEFHDRRIDTALTLARAHSAHLSCLHVTPIEAYVAFDTFGGIFVMNDVIRKLDERDFELRKKVEARLAGEDVSWDYEQATGNVESTIVSRAALADVLVTTRESRRKDFVGPTVGFLGDLLNRSRTPIFLPSSESGEFDPTGVAMIAWNGSVEAANAVRSALGFLKLASEVRVLQIPEKRPDDDAERFPATKVLAYLSRHGIHAELTVEPAPSGKAGQEVVSGMIVAAARAAGVAYVVIGAYGHTRIGEYVLGGVTRSLLKESPVSLVIAH